MDRERSRGKDRWDELYALGCRLTTELAAKREKHEELKRKEEDNFPYRPQLWQHEVKMTDTVAAVVALATVGGKHNGKDKVPALNDRMREWSQAKKEKIEVAAKEAQKAESRDCTFKPKLFVSEKKPRKSAEPSSTATTTRSQTKGRHTRAGSSVVVERPMPSTVAADKSKPHGRYSELSHKENAAAKARGKPVVRELNCQGEIGIRADREEQQLPEGGHERVAQGSDHLQRLISFFRDKSAIDSNIH